MKGARKMENIKRKTKSRKFSVHNLYPKDYCFDWEAFEADPEHYIFTKEDIAYHNAMELEEYEAHTPMTETEKRALRRWVISGHSVKEMPPSRYPCVHCHYPEPDFLEVYRTDKELDAATKGMSEEEMVAYLKEYTGFVGEGEEERQARIERERIYEQTPESVREKIRLLQRKLTYIWMYVTEEGLYEEAHEYVSAHMDEPTPFEDEW